MIITFLFGEGWTILYFLGGTISEMSFDNFEDAMYAKQCWQEFLNG